MKSIFFTTIIFIIFGIGLSSCDNSSANKLKLSVKLKTYPFLKKHEIGADLYIYNPTDGAILISQLDAGGADLALNNKTFIYYSSNGINEMVIERRLSEKNRYYNPTKEGQIFIQREDFALVLPKKTIKYKLIVFTKNKEPLVHPGVIETMFKGKIRNIGAVDKLKQKETFYGKQLDTKPYAKLGFIDFSVSSPPVRISQGEGIRKTSSE